jgi:hypothetical protein
MRRRDFEHKHSRVRNRDYVAGYAAIEASLMHYHAMM